MTDKIELKIVMVGDMNVGKTSIATRFTANQFSDNVRQTIGSTCCNREMDVDGRAVKFSVWDTAGQEVYHSLANVYFRKASAVVLTYDISKHSSLEGAKRWMDQVTAHAPKDAVIALVGNKSDLDRNVSSSDASDASAEVRSDVTIDVSAKDGTNINELFEKICKAYLKSHPNGPAASPDTVRVGNTSSNKKPCFC